MKQIIKYYIRQYIYYKVLYLIRSLDKAKYITDI